MVIRDEEKSEPRVLRVPYLRLSNIICGPTTGRGNSLKLNLLHIRQQLSKRRQNDREDTETIEINIFGKEVGRIYFIGCYRTRSRWRQRSTYVLVVCNTLEGFERIIYRVSNKYIQPERRMLRGGRALVRRRCGDRRRFHRPSGDAAAVLPRVDDAGRMLPRTAKDVDRRTRSPYARISE